MVALPLEEAGLQFTALTSQGEEVKMKELDDDGRQAFRLSTSSSGKPSWTRAR